MKLLIIVFGTFFSIQYFQYFKIKKKIKATEKYSKLHKKFIEHYVMYNNFFMENKFKNCPATVKILNRKFKTIDVLNSYNSFKDINYVSSRIKSDKRKVKEDKHAKLEFENFIQEKQLFTPEMEIFFKEIIDLQLLFLKYTNRTLYYLYVYNLKIKLPFILAVLNCLRIFLENLITRLEKCEKQQEYLKVAKENKKLEECFI